MNSLIAFPRPPHHTPELSKQIVTINFAKLVVSNVIFMDTKKENVNSINVI